MRNESIIPWSQIYITKVLIHYKIIVEKIILRTNIFNILHIFFATILS